MGKKHKHPEHENLERWLVSYADFITLLFAVFVVLYAMGQIDLAKMKKVQNSISAAFSSSFGIKDKTDGVLDGERQKSLLKNVGNSLLDKIQPSSPSPQSPATIESQAKPVGSIVKVQTIVEKINQQIDQLNNNNLGKLAGQGQGSTGTGTVKQKKVPKGINKIPHVQIFLEERGIIIRFASSLFFNSGSASIKPAGLAALDSLIGLLMSNDRIIHVEGHTDSSPINSAIYPSNWELSSSRASSVIRYFQNRYNFPAERIAAVGYGDSRPLGDNNTLSGRIKNRRVDIVILYTAYSDVADAQKQYSTDPSEQSPYSTPVSAHSATTSSASSHTEKSLPETTTQSEEDVIIPDLSKDPIAVPTKASHH